MLILFPSLSNYGSVSRIGQVHVGLDQQRAGKRPRTDPWQKAQTSPEGRVLSYWCFSPGFGSVLMVELSGGAGCVCRLGKKE